MPQLIKPGSVKLVSKDGEVSVAITIDLNINLTNLLEGASLNSSSTTEKISKKENSITEVISDKVEWAIPDFGSEKINFGK
jgi:hypothetical protein